MNKETYFINLSNHPQSAWGEDQRNAAMEYGSIIDLPFPNIDPNFTTAQVADLAKEYAEQIAQYGTPTVMCQGEFCFSYAVIRLLQKQGCRVVAACSNREVEEFFDGEKAVKKVVFRFVQFREYPDLGM